jgi:hypothetical protein
MCARSSALPRRTAHFPTQHVRLTSHAPTKSSRNALRARWPRFGQGFPILFFDLHLPPRARAWLTRVPGSARRLKNAEHENSACHHLRRSSNQEYLRTLPPRGLAFYFPLACTSRSTRCFTRCCAPKTQQKQKSAQTSSSPPLSLEFALPPRETSCVSAVAVILDPRLPLGRSSPRRDPSTSPTFS